MDTPDNLDLEQEEAKLLARLEQIKAARALVKAHEEALMEDEKRSRPFIIHVKLFAKEAGMVFMESEYSPTLVNILQRIPGRQWNGSQNAIPAGEIEALEQKLAPLVPPMKMQWPLGMREEVSQWLTMPPWHIDVHPSRRHFLVTLSPRNYNKYAVSHIPGADWDDSSRSWKLPLSEGWRLYKALENETGVAYTEDAQAIILAQVEKRGRMDVLAGLLDTEDERLKVLSHGVYSRRYKEEVPFWKALEGFQRVGVVYGIESGGRLLIGDDTGLGKTWQAYALCEYWRLSDMPTLQTIIVCKAGNVRNWYREGLKLTGIEPLICKGGKPDFFMIQQIVMKRHPYVIISHDTLGTYHYDEEDEEEKTEIYTWVGIIKATNPDVLVIDEAHQIKNPDTHRSRAARQLARIPRVIEATASPVLNRTEELWPLLYMLDPDTFKSHDQFVNTYTYGGRSPRNTQQLHDLMKPMFIRRQKKDVQKDLPPINRVTLYHDLSPRALKLYEKALTGVFEEMEHFNVRGESGREMSIMAFIAKIQRLKQICGADCTETTVEKAQSLIEEKPDGKVLIFTQWKGTCDSIRRSLGDGAISTVSRSKDGFVSMNPDQRDRLFEEARHDPKVKYIVTVAHPATGLEGHNIEFCDWVIFNDLLWGPKAHDQCEGRAYGRLSDPHSIDSFYVVADADIIRMIMDLLDKKLAIIQESVDNIEATRDISGSIARELMQKIKEMMWRAA